MRLEFPKALDRSPAESAARAAGDADYDFYREMKRILRFMQKSESHKKMIAHDRQHPAASWHK